MTDTATTPTTTDTDEPAAGAGPVPGWTITWEGDSWSWADITGQHLSFISLFNGADTWAHCDLRPPSPEWYQDSSPAVGPGRLMSWIVTFVAVRDKITDDTELAQLVREVSAAGIDELIGAVEFHD